MSRFVVGILPAAEDEFRAAFLWYSERSPSAADTFRARVISAIDGLADDADRWPIDAQGLRLRVLTRFPYTIWYEIEGSQVSVMAIAHQHRRPHYWKNRDC